MRIVILGPTYPYRGGIAHHTTLLARHLARHHGVDLLTFRAQYPRWLFPGRTDRDPSATVVEAPAERVLDPLRPWTWWSTARRIRRGAPDLVLVAWWVPFWAPSLAAVAALVRRAGGPRVVFVCHNVLPHDGGGVLARWAARLALGRGDGFIVHSASDAEALGRLVALGGRPVRRAVLPSHTIASGTDRAAARRTLGLPAEAPIALFFGFVRPYKGLPYLIEALPAARRAVPGLRLVVAGEFWEPAERTRRRAAALGVGGALRIDDRYIPNEEVGHYFAAADVVVMPYVEATQSGVVTLAVTFSRPIIATRVGGLPEVVEHGVTGLVVAPGDPAALAGALGRYFGEAGLRARLEAGTRAARARFGWGHLVDIVEGLAAPAADAPPDGGTSRAPSGAEALGSRTGGP